MKRFAMLGLAVAVAALPATANDRLTISGFIDVGFYDIESDWGSARAAGFAAGNLAGSNGDNMRSSLNEIDLDIRAELTDNMQAFVSLDSIQGGALTPDEAWIEWSNPGSFDLNVRSGLVPSSIGIENRWKESNQTTFTNLSLVSAWTVGTREGVQAYGTWSPINWQVAATNQDPFGDANSIVATTTGLAGGVGATPGNNGSPTGNRGATGQGNNNAAFSGRIGVLPIEGLEIGVSASTAEVQTSTGAAGASELSRTMFGVDLQYRYGPFGLAGEYLSADEDQAGTAAGSSVNGDIRAFYLQGTYDFTDQITFGLRYSDVALDDNAGAGQFQAFDYDQISVNASYDLAENVVVKVQYDINDESVIRSAVGGANLVANTGEPDNDTLSAAVVASF